MASGGARAAAEDAADRAGCDANVGVRMAVPPERNQIRIAGRAFIAADGPIEFVIGIRLLAFRPQRKDGKALGREFEGSAGERGHFAPPRPARRGCC